MCVFLFCLHGLSEYFLFQQKLKGLYNTALNDALEEEEFLRQALTKITEIRNICNERRLLVIVQ